MKENAILFGEDKSLVGILTNPAADVTVRKQGVVILNAGVLHRVGPNRVHVLLARALAGAGFPVLRFDFSGIGDSARRAGNEPFARQVVREAGEALDLLARSRGVSEFLLLGICSGADHGLQVSHLDKRVVGAALIDGYNLPSLLLLLHFYRGKLLKPRSWIRFLAGRSLTWGLLRTLTVESGATRATLAQAESVLPTRAEYVSQTFSLADRGTELLLLYTGQSPAYYNYRKRLRRKLARSPSRERVRVERMADSDHVFTLSQNQGRLVDLVRSWATGVAGRRA